MHNNNNHRAQLFCRSSSYYITLSSDESADENHVVASTNENKTADTLGAAATTAITTGIKRSVEYIPQTINPQNQNRLSILPMFPKSINDQTSSHLLLVNVAEEHLSVEQLTLRHQYQQQTANQSLPHIFNKQYHLITSSLRNYFETFYQVFIDLFHIDWRILDYNYIRLDDCLQRFANERIHRLRQIPSELRLPDEEKLIAMEIFLQMDIDLFYWKNFSNRHRQLHNTDTNIYAAVSDLFSTYGPQIRFTMKSCGYPNCRICSSTINNLTHRPYPCLNFGASAVYQFLNGYKSILNALVMCNTTGIIYVLKCPCGQHEYVGESSNHLLYTMDRHRTNGNRVMHYFLTGEPPDTSDNVHHSNPLHLNSSDIIQKNSMRLYQHSAHCTTVMQMFLNCYPHYWIFVPMPISLVQQENANYIKHEPIFATTTSSRPFATTTTTRATREAIRDDHEIELFLKNIPLPPSNYQFSKQQRDKQIDFFRYKKDQQLPSLPLNLYDASILLVLPAKTSIVLRQFLASLFITHGQTSLNSIGNLLVDNNANLSLPLGSLRGNWCHNLTNRP